MDPNEREAWLQGHRKDQERKVEASRQSNPSSRPLHQQQYLAHKQEPGVTNWSETGAHAVYSAQAEDRASREKRARFFSRRHKEECEQAAAEGKPRPDTPEEAKLSSPGLVLNSNERLAARDTFEGHGKDSETNHGLGMGDRFAISVSKKLDAFKKTRKGSDSSDMDFADCAPSVSMHVCVVCGMPSTTYLKGEKCEQCHVFSKNKGRS